MLATCSVESTLSFHVLFKYLILKTILYRTVSYLLSCMGEKLDHTLREVHRFEGIWKKGAEGNIWMFKIGSKRRMEKLQSKELRNSYS